VTPVVEEQPEGSSRDMPTVLAGQLRAHGATETELIRFREEHSRLSYYDRFLANQQAVGMQFDPASVQALLELSRQRWADSGESEPEPEPAESEDTEGVSIEQVPSGTIPVVEAWVGSDLARARAALSVERASTDPRPSLIRKLEQLVRG